jgi:hypothetical protein
MSGKTLTFYEMVAEAETDPENRINNKDTIYKLNNIN